ncbi:nuclear transport factor 2 family protein [Vibrio sp. JC009]|uniref:nuclear transport factor 2 family protein n=1 Tax=Vibrio sp. JC009 TaxID=2912314 RepID=UPI0023B2061F|nr:nuclear transport factor 2 family protein [Vibrio sp. JC009]WED22018.1 nuclear transport factor 2 family protein [Vibrio sp. JC009]
MINILIPLSGKNTFKVNSVNSFPKFLSEVNGKLLIEHAAEPFTSLGMEKKIIVAVPEKQSEKYKLNSIIRLLGEDIQTCLINGNTQGAVCSALLAVESLDLDSPLIISSFEQVLELDLTPYIQDFIEESADAGVFTFEAIHPKWSYVKIGEYGNVTESAEKVPISKHAIAGLYYYKTARSFVEAAKSVIRKDVKTNDSFFISSTLNEIILNEGVVRAVKIDNKKYFHINDEHTLENFEIKLSEDREKHKKAIKRRSEDYIVAFDSKDINLVSGFFSDDFSLTDPSASIQGKKEVCEYIAGIFNNVRELSFSSKNIFITGELQSIIEFELIVDGQTLIGTDVIQWNKELEMVSMDAYLYEVNNGQA